MTGSPEARTLQPAPAFELTRRVWSWVSRTGLSVKLVLLSALLTAAVVSLAFFALSVELRASLKRLFAEELNRNQYTLLELQTRTLRELRWTLSLVTDSPTLRAAMETYRVESAAGGPRSQLLATIQGEVEKIVGGLGKDLLVVTDDQGLVLAASERLGARPALDADLSNVPAVRRSLDPSPDADEPSSAVVRFQGEYFQVASVPIVLRGFTIGTAILGERLDQTFVRGLRKSFDGEILVVTEGTLISSTLPASLTDSRAVAALASRVEAAEGRSETLRLGQEDFVTAALPLGLNQAGQPVVLYLLHSLTNALNRPNRALRLGFLLYGSLAVVLAVLGTGALSRSALRPLGSFVGFMGSVAETGSYSSRFDSSRAGVEIRTLNDSYNHLIESLAQKHGQLEHRTAELSRANEDLTETIAERERAERALRESEEQLRQSQKLEALGTLAGGVAHDFNNLLTVISSYAELLMTEVDPAGSMRSDLEQIKQSAHRAATLTNQLLAFSRRQVLQPKVIDLNTVVGGVEVMLRRLIGEDIELRTVNQTTVSRIKADPSQIEQVIVNLAVNARDAMPSGGKLEIETADVQLEERWAGGEDSVRPGRWVMLSVSDSGVGMDEATRTRIFEPFFTTKEPGKGTGLGLATVYGIVKQSGGSIRVESEPGKGTTFKIYLPAIDEAADALWPSVESQQAPTGSETVLLVEDEDAVRALAQRCLERSGYQVLAARHGLEALEVAGQHSSPIHLLLTDVVMPHMGGKKLAERLTPLRREMRVLYTSGYTDDAIVHHGNFDHGTELLQKPFTPDVLLRKVREVLDAAKESKNGIR